MLAGLRRLAMAAGITAHCWTVRELLSFRVATVAVDTTQAARASRTGTATPGEALVLMTTVKGGATA